MAENLSFHSVRLLGHNGTSKPVKVPILPLALFAAVAGKLTTRTTFKVLSFFGWLLTVRTNTIYTGTVHNHIVVTIVTINSTVKYDDFPANLSSLYCLAAQMSCPPDYSQKISKSKRPRIGQNVPMVKRSQNDGPHALAGFSFKSSWRTPSSVT